MPGSLTPPARGSEQRGPVFQYVVAWQNQFGELKAHPPVPNYMTASENAHTLLEAGYEVSIFVEWFGTEADHGTEQ